MDEDEKFEELIEKSSLGTPGARALRARGKAMMQERAILEMVRISEESGLYGEPPTVCVTHARFIPCRADDGCLFSSETADIAKVRVIQGITPAD